MNRLFQFLRNPMVYAVLGALALCVIVWNAGPLLAFGESRPLESELTRALLIALIAGLVLGKLVWGLLKRRKTNAALVNGMAKGPSAADRELGTLDQRFTQALDVLKNAPAGGGKGLFKGGAYLYELPWYIFVGAPGSGKTTALLNAGLTFPLAEKMGAGGVRGVGGTRNCDWWFTDEAVLIDTAGRYTTQESDSQTDAAAWDGFLALLKKSRPRRPINGVLLTVNIQDLLQQNPNERKEHAAKLRARMQELTEKLGVKAPVYVLVTKTDLIAGFNEFFGELGREERNQVWGFSFPFAPDQADDPLVNFGSEFAALEKRIRERVIDRMDAEPDVLKRAAIFNFPQQFAGVKGLLGGFLEQVFSAGGNLEERPLLRGVYFTSGTQEGTPIDRVMSTLARTFGVERRVTSVGSGRTGKSFFLHRLLKDVVFNEQGLVGENRAMELRRARLRLAGLVATLVVSVAVVSLWGVSYVKNQRYVAAVDAKLPELKKAVDAIPPANNGDVSPLPDVLAAVRNAPVDDGFSLIDPPLTMTMGLYQGEKLDAGAQLGYRRLLEQALLPRIAKRLEERLRASNRDNLEQAYESLKHYLMLYTPQQMDAESFKAWVGVDWDNVYERSLKPEQREALSAHLDALVAQGLPPVAGVPMDQALVAQMRDMLVAFPLEYRVFSRLKRTQLGADLPPFSVAGEGGPQALNVLTRASGEPLTKGIPGLFTREGYRQAFEKSVEKATRQLAIEQEWVLGVKAAGDRPLDSVKANPELTNRVRRLYFEEYIKVWDKYIADVKVIKPTSVEQNLSIARALAGVDSPLTKFLRGVARETTLVQPKQQGGTSPSSIGVVAAAEAKLNQAKREAAILAGKMSISTDATGAPLEAMVDEHFEPIRRLFDGTPPPIQETQKLFEAVYVHLAALDAAQKSKSAPPPPAGLEAAKTGGGQQPEPIRGVIEALAGSAGTQARNVEVQAAASELKPTAEFCNRTVNGRYPFTPSSKADVLPDDFAQLFGVGGQLDEFFKTKLANLVDTGANPWAFKPTTDGAKTVSPAALADFQRAARIREVFFRGGGKQPSFKVDIRAIEMDPALKEIVLDIDGQPQKFVAGSTAPVTVQWPSAKVASQINLTTVPAGSTMNFDGPWALFRLFDRFEVQPTTQPERFTVALNLDGRKARLEVTASSVFNPFRLKEMQQFRCPGSL